MKIFVPAQHLTNFEIQKYHQDEYKINGVYTRNNWSKIKNGVYEKYEKYEKSWWVWINRNSLDSIIR